MKKVSGSWANRNPGPGPNTGGQYPATLFGDPVAGGASRPHQPGLTLGPVRDVLARTQILPKTRARREPADLDEARARRVQALIEHYDRVGRYEERSGESP